MTARIEFSVGLMAGLRAEREVAAACEKAMGAAGIKAPAFGPHEPVIVTVDVYRPLPDNRPRCVRSESDTYKPSADGEGKLVMDALNGVAWADDSQVVDLHVRKHPMVRGQAERMDITIAPGWRGNETQVEVETSINPWQFEGFWTAEGEHGRRTIARRM